MNFTDLEIVVINPAGIRCEGGPKIPRSQHELETKLLRKYTTKSRKAANSRKYHQWSKYQTNWRRNCVLQVQKAVNSRKELVNSTVMAKYFSTRIHESARFSALTKNLFDGCRIAFSAHETNLLAFMLIGQGKPQSPRMLAHLSLNHAS